jgi:ankyrin repeat protein
MINGSQEPESEKPKSSIPTLFAILPPELFGKIVSELPFAQVKELRLINKELSSLDTVDENLKKFASDSVENNVKTDIGLWHYCFEYPVLQKIKPVRKEDKKQFREYRKKIERYYDSHYNQNYDDLYQNLFAYHCPVEKLLSSDEELIIGSVKIGKQEVVLNKEDQKILHVSGREFFYKNKENEFIPNENDPQICWLYSGDTLENLLNTFESAKIKPKKIVLVNGISQIFFIEILEIISANPIEETEKTKKLNCISLWQNNILQNLEGETILVFACFANDLEQPWQLLDSKQLHIRDNKGRTLLHHACEKGNTKIAQLLINNGISVHSRDKNGNTPLHCAIHKKDLTLLLLKAGANPNSQNKNGDTPLHHIYPVLILDNIESYLEYIRTMCEYKANLNIQNNNLNTPFHLLYKELNLLIAIRLSFRYRNLTRVKNQAEALKALKELFIQYGADLTIKNNKGKTPLDYNTRSLKTDLIIGLLVAVPIGYVLNKFALPHLRTWLAKKKNSPTLVK